jgi:4-amino-4-deoxy-L-arabinose transferase-like glycosyltransferase
VISAWETLHPRARRWLLFAVVALVYFALRATTDIVWNDTVALAQFRYDTPPMPPSWLIDQLPILFGVVERGVPYRPLAHWLANVCVDEFGMGPLDIRIWIAVFAAVIGATGVAVYSVAARLLKSQTWALVATLLFLCGPGFLTAAWVVLAGIQALVPLGLCLGLLLYWRATETQGRRRALNLLGLGVIFLLGPWYREFFGILPLLVIFEEVRRRRRPTAITAFAAVGFLHAVFPTALTKLPVPCLVSTKPRRPRLSGLYRNSIGGRAGDPRGATRCGFPPRAALGHREDVA